MTTESRYLSREMNPLVGAVDITAVCEYKLHRDSPSMQSSHHIVVKFEGEYIGLIPQHFGIEQGQYWFQKLPIGFRILKVKL